VICVITTVQEPTLSVRHMHARLREHDIPLIVVGDKKGPPRFELPGARFVPLEEQAKTNFALAPLLPTGHYVRKNLGYLLAFAAGASAIFETDDDNAPNTHWSPKTLQTTARPLAHTGWANVYRCFTDANIWPRGFPLRHARDRTTYLLQPARRVESPIQQLLTNHAPDVDAAWRLTVGAEPFSFASESAAVLLNPGAWCPFNSQSTWWFRPAFPLMYLPSTCTFRMTDIWRSLVAQRCLWELNQGVTFHPPEVDQERNAHDLMRDFEDEVPGYLLNERIAAVLAGTKLTGAMTDDLVRCYEALVAGQILRPEELTLVRAWVADCNRVSA
jgi:hypothetical protein